MRPLFAIAPLALLLALIGPTPNEANEALNAFKARLWSPAMPTHATQQDHQMSVAQPALYRNSPAFSATTVRSSFEATATQR